MSNTYIYLASPYSAPDPHTMELRYLGVMRACHWLLRQRLWTYSPIVHCHEIAKTYALPKDRAYWQEYNDAMLRGADELLVLAIAGWRESTGVTAEIAYAREIDKPTRLLRLQGYDYRYASSDAEWVPSDGPTTL